MEKCKRCGERRAWDQYGYCERCHDEIYVENMKKLAGDASKESGIVRAGIGKATCRLCGVTMPTAKIEKRTGYCKLCIEQLNLDKINKRLDSALEMVKGLGLAKEDPAEEKEAAAEGGKSFTARVHGISFRKDAVISLLDENDDYNLSKAQIIDEGLEDATIYKYNMLTAPAKLIPEPNNPEDPNAIAVYVYDEHIGYIAKGMTSRIHKLIRENTLDLVLAEVRGGPYKYLTEAGIIKGEYEFSCTLTITIKASE